MGHSKQNKGQKKDGNHRSETREERKLRLQEQAEAREACFKIVPYVGGAVVLLLILFGAYVNSLPPKAPKQKASTTRTSSTQKPPATKGGVDMSQLLQQAMDGDGNIQITPEMLKEMGMDTGDIKVDDIKVTSSNTPPPPEGEGEEGTTAEATTEATEGATPEDAAPAEEEAAATGTEPTEQGEL